MACPSKVDQKSWKTTVSERNKHAHGTRFFHFVSHLLLMVACTRLVVVCVYGGIRVTTAPTVNGQSGKRQTEREREREDRPCVEHTILLTLSWCHVGWHPLHHIHAQMLQER